MSIRFRTFRRILLGLIGAISVVCIALSIQLQPNFYHRTLPWIIVAVSSACLLRSTWSFLRKPLLKQTQTVASETIELFLLLPFELVLALVTSTSSLEHEHTAKLTPIVLQVLLLANTIINLSYTACLLLTALITASAYDIDIWIRDIDSSPSPFPMSILFFFVFPCLSRSASSTTTLELDDEVLEVDLPHCLPGCNCGTKPQSPMISRENSSVSTNASSVRLDAPNRASNSGSTAASLSRSLVRIPDAAERRMSIAIAFEV